jgi:hypothetical protein
MLKLWKPLKDLFSKKTHTITLRSRMKFSVSTVVSLFWGIAFFPILVNAQNLTGIWKGYFITKDYSQYKVEFQIKQSGNNLTGVSYSYLNTVYYGKATMSGNFHEANLLSIQEIKTVEVKASEGSVNCLMHYNLNYSKSGREEYLEGSFTSKYETESSTQGIKKGEDCGGGKVYLRRVTSSDFYPEPFLQNSTSRKVIINEAPPARKGTASTTKNPSEQKSTPIVTNSSSLISKSFKEESTSSLPAKAPASIPPVANNRLNSILKELTVNSPQVKVSLFDNGEVDGDTVSVYLNSKRVLSNKRLGTTPLELTLHLDQENSLQEITVVAENLGRIPPNSALMIVEAGEQRYRVQITSTEQKNAVVRFRYETNKP